MLEIVRYISRDIGNPDAAERLAATMIEKGEAIREMPYLCPACIPLRPLAHEYRKAIVKHFLMFYWVDEEGKLGSVARVIYSKRYPLRVQNKFTTSITKHSHFAEMAVPLSYDRNLYDHRLLPSHHP